MKSIRNPLILLLTAFIWGIAFVFQTTGGNATGPFTFACVRSVIAAIALLPAIKLLDRAGLTHNRPQTKAQWKTLMKAGLLCGLCLAMTSICQQLGLYMGTATGKAGFLTACYIILVPVLGIFLKRRCGWNVWLAVLITVFGLYLLCMNGSISFQTSDLIILGGALACALHILVVDHYMYEVDAVRLNLVQIIVAALITSVPMFWSDMQHSMVGFQDWLTRMSTWEAWSALLYAGLFSSAIGYTLQCVGQQGVHPTVASLLMSFESVFSVLGGWLILGQHLSTRELLGCLLIFVAVIFAQIPMPTKKGAA